MADNYDFKKMFSQDSGQMEENDFRACNTLFMANALGQPEADISNGYENVIENFTGEKAPSSEAVFNQIWGMIEDKDRAISPWTSQISEAIGAEEPPVYNGGFWNEVGRRATEGLAMGEARSKSILGSAVDLIPSMTRGFGTLVTQIGEAVGIADEQQEFFDDIMSNPFIATMLATPSQFITESGEFNKQAKAEMRELSKEYSKPAVVFDELYTSVLDTMIYLQAMKLGGMQIGGTPSQAAGAELSTQMTSRLVAAGKLGAFKGVFSEANSLQERADIASITAMYMSTPAASGLFESGKSVFLADLMMNTAITTPQVNELWERDDIDDFDKILETVKMVGSDVVFSAMTKTMRGNRLSPNWKPMQEASRQLIKDEKNAEHRANFSKVSEAYNDPKKVPKPGFLLNRVEGEADKATQAGKGFINAEAAKTQSAKDIDDLQRTLMEQEKVTTPEGREVKVVKDEVLDDTGKPAEAPQKPTAAEPGAKEAGAGDRITVYHTKWSGVGTGKSFGGFHAGTQKAGEQRTQDILDSETSRVGPVKAKELLGNKVVEEYQIDKADIYMADNPMREQSGEYKILEIPTSKERQALIKQGYKGVAYTNVKEDAGSVSYMLFEKPTPAEPGAKEAQVGPIEGRAETTPKESTLTPDEFREKMFDVEITKYGRVKGGVSAMRKRFDNAISAVGDRVIDRVGSSDVESIVNYYVKKYNLPKIDIIYVDGITDRTGGYMAAADKGDRYRIAIDPKTKDVLNESQIAGALRHEIEHVLEAHRGFTPEKSAYRWGMADHIGGKNAKNQTGIISKMLNEVGLSNNEFYKFFETDYLHRSMVKESLKAGDPVSISAVREYGLTLPDGYIVDGKIASTSKQQPQKPTPAEPGAKETLAPPKPIEPSQASQRRKVLLDTITRTAEMNIDKRVDEINRTMQDLENGVPPREVTSRVKQRVNRATGVTKQPGTIRVNEYQMLKKQIRDYNKGAKAGKQLGKKAEKARVAEREAKIADIRRIAADYARSQIHSKDLLDSVKNTIGKITADTQLDKALAKIDERVAEQKHRDAVKGVDKELKKLKKMKLHPTQQKNIDALLDGIATTKTSDKKLGSLLSSKKFFEAEVRFENELPDYLNKAIEGLEDKQLRDLTTEDLNVLKMGIQRIRSNQELREELTERGQRRKIEKWATDFDATVRGDSPLHRLDKEGHLKDPKKGGVLGALNKLDLNPDGQAFIIDGGREGIAHQVFVKNFWAGDDKRLVLEQHASRYMEPHHDMIKGWDKSDISTQIGDKKVKISRGERIAIYLDSLNPQNESHQLGGGYVLRSNPGIPLKMTADQRDKIIDGMTAEDFKVAQTIQDGYQNILRPALNETSVKVIGHEIAVIDNYHPMSSARMFMDSGDGKIMPSDLKSFSEYLLGSSGHFKERTVGAKNPIVLQDAIKKYDQMVSLISKYHGYAEPLRDAKQFLDGKTANGDPVRQVIASTSGTKYNEMMDDLLKDLEGGYEKSTRGWLRKSNAVLNKATNKIVRGILGHNIKVAGLQPVSYATAKNVVPMKYWAEGLKSSPASWDEMAEHSPLMWDRGKGHLSIAFGESTKEKRANRGMQMIRTMDRNAVGRIWRAYEAMGRDEGNGTIDYKKVAERTNDAVRRTQPTFEIIDRPAIARTDNVVYRSLSMFTSQRNKNHTLKLKNDVGMFGKLKDGTATDKDWKEWGNKTVINRIIVPSLVAGYQAAWAMAMGKKYEDDERTVLNRFGNKYIDSQLSEAGPLAGSILAEVKAVIAGLDDSVEGREVSSALIKTWKNLERDVGAVADAIKLDDEILFAEDREKVDEKRAKAIESLLRNIAIASGRGEYHYYDYAKMIQSWTEEDGELSFEQN